jgi:transposase InsO family protein
VTQTARNLVMDLEDVGCRVKYLIRDRDGKYPALFDAVLADAGITVVLSGVRTPRMNAVMERWVRTCRRRRDPPRVRLCRLNCPDGIFGSYRGPRRWVGA